VTVSLDVLLGTLIFILPGFIAVGAYVGLGRFFSRPDLARGTFVLLALALSIPIVLVFNTVAPHLGLNLIHPLSVPILEAEYVAPPFLFSLSILYAVCAGLGALVALAFNWWIEQRRKRNGVSITTNRLDVWTSVLGSRKQTPYVLAVLEKAAYHGLLSLATTEEDDPYIFIIKPEFVPLDSNQRPAFQERTPLHMDGVLLKKSDIQAFWFVS